jgi:ATP-dependent DNA ligase
MKASELTRKYSIKQLAQRLTLAETYPDTPRPHKFLIQPKLDGVRAFYIPGFGFVSRDGKKMATNKMQHIQFGCTQDLIVDGEFYCHGMPLGDINSRVAFTSRVPHEDEKSIKFHAFDVMDFLLYQVDRLEIVKQIVASSNNVYEVSTFAGETIDELQSHHDKFVNRGFEGSMIKANVKGYIVGRTQHVLKYKRWFVIDATCVGFNLGTPGHKYENVIGSLQFTSAFDPAIIWNVAGMTDAERSKDPEKFIGRRATIRFSCRPVTGQLMHASIIEWL